MNKPSIATILRNAAERPRVEDSIEYLQKYESLAVKQVLYLLWEPSIKFHEDLPEGKTPYKPSQYDEPGRLYSEMRRMYLFLANNPQSANLTKQKRQQLWIQLLESISPDDAELLDALKDKRSPWKRISRHLTRKAYPGLLSYDKSDDE